MRNGMTGAVLVALILGISGCSSYDAASDGGGDGGTNGPVTGTPLNPRLTIVDVEEAVLLQGGSTTIKVTFTRGDADGAVTLTSSDLPEGVTAPDVVVPPGATEASVQLTASANAVQGNKTISFAATAPITGQQPALATASSTLLVRGGRGALDTTFGQAGKLSALLGSGLDATGFELTLYSDDRVGVVVQRESTSKGFVVRTTRDGLLDPTFGAGGRQELTHLPTTVQADASGNLYTAGASGNLRTMVRLKPDGAVDTQFGDAGVSNLNVNLAYYNFTPHVISVEANDVRVFGDYYAGSSSVEYNYPVENVVTIAGRFSSRAQFNFDSKGSGLGVARRADGRALVAGVSYSYTTTEGVRGGIGLARTNADGTLDQGFAGGGTSSLYKGISLASQPGVVSDYGVRPPGIVIAPDDKVYVPFAMRDGLFLMRFAADGFKDVAYGASGVRGPLIPATTLGSLGRVLPLGNDGFLVALSGLHSIRIAKFDFQGILDRNFGSDGIATYAFGDSVETQGARMAIQSDGRIVVMTTAVGSTKDAVLLRFWN